MIRFARLQQYRLSVFGKSPASGRYSYVAYVKAGYGQGRRLELTGSRSICSLGGWAAAKKLCLKRQDRVKGGERILEIARYNENCGFRNSNLYFGGISSIKSFGDLYS